MHLTFDVAKELVIPVRKRLVRGCIYTVQYLPDDIATGNVKF